MEKEKCPVTQQDLMGCGIACVAFICGIGYKTAKRRYFRGLGDANRRGYLCRDMVTALSATGRRYIYKYLKRRMRYPPGTIVFIRRSKRYPVGHYLAKSGKGWMDPWMNFDSVTADISHARSGFRQRCLGRRSTPYAQSESALPALNKVIPR